MGSFAQKKSFGEAAQGVPRQERARRCADASHLALYNCKKWFRLAKKRKAEMGAADRKHVRQGGRERVERNAQNVIRKTQGASAELSWGQYSTNVLSCQIVSGSVSAPRLEGLSPGRSGFDKAAVHDYTLFHPAVDPSHGHGCTAQDHCHRLCRLG